MRDAKIEHNEFLQAIRRISILSSERYKGIKLEFKEDKDRKAVEELYAFHVPVFQRVPRPSFPDMQALRDFLVKKYPAAVSLKESDIADSSFIDELERSGFIDRLYAD
jgi:hypothetical protein